MLRLDHRRLHWKWVGNQTLCSVQSVLVAENDNFPNFVLFFPINDEQQQSKVCGTVVWKFTEVSTRPVVPRLSTATIFKKHSVSCGMSPLAVLAILVFVMTYFPQPLIPVFSDQYFQMHVQCEFDNHLQPLWASLMMMMKWKMSEKCLFFHCSFVQKPAYYQSHTKP